MSDNEWQQPAAPPPPLFAGKKEKDLVKQINDEVVERVVGQQLIYYPISIEHTNFNPIYGEAIKKTFLSPVRVYAFVKYQSQTTRTTNLGVDRVEKITRKFLVTLSVVLLLVRTIGAVDLVSSLPGTLVL